MGKSKNTKMTKTMKKPKGGKCPSRALIVALFVAMLAMPTFAQVSTDPQPPSGKLQESGTSLVLMGSTFTNDKFKSVSGGIKFGGILPLLPDQGIYLRTVYSRFNFGKDSAMSNIETQALSDWYLGKKWKLYVMLGGATYTGGENGGTDFIAGVGASRRIWTAAYEVGAISAGLDVYGEISFTDATGQNTGSFAQLNIGLKFNKGKGPAQ